MKKIQSRKFFLTLITVISAFGLALYKQTFDPSVIVTGVLGLYFGSNVWQKKNEEK